MKIMTSDEITKTATHIDEAIHYKGNARSLFYASFMLAMYVCVDWLLAVTNISTLRQHYADAIFGLLFMGVWFKLAEHYHVWRASRILRGKREA